MPEHVDCQGLIWALVLDGAGRARQISWAALQDFEPGPDETLWVHLDRSSSRVVSWLRQSGWISAFDCDVLLEENTRPRVLLVPDGELLLFLRGVNRNPGAEPEDMISLRIYADARRVISLRMRPMRAADEVAHQLLEGLGPKNASEILLHLADALLERIAGLITRLSERVDDEEERIDSVDDYQPDHDAMLDLRRRSAALRRFLAPQRDVCLQLAKSRVSWFMGDDPGYWNELGNQLVHYLEELDLVRERVMLILETEQRRLNEQTGRTMYLLTLVTGFFLPVSFITGLLGINVGGVPGADNPEGFLIACLLIALVAFFQWLVFRRLRWV